MIGAGGGEYSSEITSAWADPAPTTINVALDRLAFALYTHLGTPVP
jgi:hypothetical protein